MIYAVTCYHFLYLLYQCKIVNSEWVQIKVPGQSGMQFVSGAWSTSSNCVVVGNQGSSSTKKGQIIRTVNKGLSWSISNLTGGSFGRLTDVSTTPGGYLNKAIFLAVDYSTSLPIQGRIYISNNNGTSWTTAATKYGGKTSFPKLNAITMGLNGIAYAAGYVSGNGFKIFSSSYSTTFTVWNNVSYLSKDMIIQSITTYDGVNVIAVGTNTTSFIQHGIIYSTQNGGIKWTAAPTYSNSVQVIYSASSASSSVAMIAGDSGYVAKTNDGGLSWNIVNVFNSTGYVCLYHSISMVSASIIFISGFIQSSEVTSVIYKSTDGGSTWNIEQSGISAAYSLSMYNSIIGVAGTSQGLYVRTSSMKSTKIIYHSIYIYILTRSY